MPERVPVSPLAGTTVVATAWDVVPMEPALRASLPIGGVCTLRRQIDTAEFIGFAAPGCPVRVPSRKRSGEPVAEPGADGQPEPSTIPISEQTLLWSDCLSPGGTREAGGTREDCGWPCW